MRPHTVFVCLGKIIITWICVSLLVELLNAKSLTFYEPRVESFATFSCAVSSHFMVSKRNHIACDLSPPKMLVHSGWPLYVCYDLCFVHWQEFPYNEGSCVRHPVVLFFSILALLSILIPNCISFVWVREHGTTVCTECAPAKSCIAMENHLLYIYMLLWYFVFAIANLHAIVLCVRQKSF